ncbi:MAG: DUF6048 family protein [Bacteroidales bacterium]|nr:DUF6048 family protein [Bacteroidales bacterium]
MRKLLLAITVIAVVLTLSAQRRITPVTPAPAAGEWQPAKRDTTRSAIPDTAHMAHYHDEQGRVVWVDTVTGREWMDSTLLPAAPKMEYPLLSGISVGVDLWDPLMRCFGQKYGLIGFSAGVNLHNRYRPIVEVGLGEANYTPDDGNFTYKGKMAPFFKIGMDYNFIYNNNAAYEAYAGLRYGLSPMKYEITNVTMESPYWREETGFNIPSQSITAQWVEALFGIKVKIIDGFYLGWTIKYHGTTSLGKPRYGEPWYIPGYGTKQSHWAGAFNLFYTLPLNKKKAPDVITDETGGNSDAGAQRPPRRLPDDNIGAPPSATVDSLTTD